MPPPAPATRAVFLHTGWRSGGTWIWSRLRAHAGVRAYYEPLHDVLAALDDARIARETPDAWESRHGGSAPYFTEYAPLLRRRRSGPPRGVAHYEPNFAHERYFMPADEADDALRFYLCTLLDAAADRVPVLKFCRSLGRVPWMQRQFPAALHAVMLRNPVAQWRSAEAQLSAGNRFFTVAPLLVLARNRRAPLVRETVERFAIHLPALPAHRRDLDAELCWRHCQRLDEAARYRQFLAFWTASAIGALASSALLIDAELMAEDGPHRASVTQALRRHTGLDIALDTHVPPARATIPAGEQAAHAAALAMLHDRRADLSPGALVCIAGKLAIQAEPRPAPPPPPAAWRDADAQDAASRLRRAAYFAAIGASMPLRHWHGRLRS